MASQKLGVCSSRTTVFAVVIVLVVLSVGVVALILFPSTSPPTKSRTSMTSSSYSSEPQPGEGQGNLSVSAVYANFGYPKLTYSDYFSYAPSKPNFTMEYHGLSLGVENASVIGLNQAVSLATKGLNLTVPLQLGYATFYPGTIVNGTLTIHPMWYLFLAAEYNGYWAWGSYGNGAFSVEADIDALSGTPPTNSGGIDVSSLPNSGQFKLLVNSSAALAALRSEGGSIQGVPAALTKNGTVSFMEPRFVLLGQSSNNAAFENPLNSSLSGQKRLCWVIQLYSHVPEYGYQGTFAVDAETGRLVSGTAETLFPITHIYTVTGLPEYSSAQNLTISSESFQIKGSIIGRSGMLKVAVPDVVIAKQGSSSEIDFNFTSNFLDRSMNLSLQSFSNPLPGLQNLSAEGLPGGVSVHFLAPNVSVPANGTSVATISISTSKTAPSGTYLLKLEASWSGPPGGQSAVIFLFTVWNGDGAWPAPPGVG